MAKRKTARRQKNPNEGQSVKYKAAIRDVPIVVGSDIYFTDIVFKTVNKATADSNRDGYKSNVFAYVHDNRVVVNYKKIFFSIKEKDLKKHTRKAVGVSMYAAIAEAVFNIYKNIDENGSHVHDICIDTIQTMRLLKYNERQIKSAQTAYLKNLLTCMDKYQKKTKDMAMFRYDVGELEEDDEDDDDIWEDDEDDEDEEDEAPKPKSSKKKAKPAESGPKDEKPVPKAEPEKDEGPETTTYVEPDPDDEDDIEGDGSEMLAAHVLGGLPIGPAKDKNTQKLKKRKGKTAKNAS